jgi:hypothetical protein
MRAPFPFLRPGLALWIGLVFLLPGVVRVHGEPPVPPAAALRNRPYGSSAVAQAYPIFHPHMADTSLVPVPTGSDAPGANWDRIVFQSYLSDNWEIILSNSDGSSPLQLTNHPASDITPRLNRGGTKIAFVSNRDGNYEIYTMSLDGSGLSRLTSNDWNDYTPAWSPDSSKIVYVTDEKGNLDLAVMSVEGAARTLLTSDLSDDFSPVWSPDGSQIAWVRQEGYFGRIWLMNADGSNPHPLSESLLFLENLSWSPDGTRIAFDYDGDRDGWTELGWIKVDGTGLEIFSDQNFSYTDVLMGSWSPLGTQAIVSVVFYQQDGENWFPGQMYLAVSYLTDEFLHPLPAMTSFEAFPDWQTLDIIAPTSQVKKIPSYTRSIGVKIEWMGEDQGLAGLSNYDVQVRVGKQGAWTDWQMGTTATSAIYAGEAGSTIYFRSRAHDEAGNVEAWPAGDGDTATTLFTWQIEGQITDAREIPLPYTLLAFSPAPLVSVETGFPGTYLARMTTEGVHTLQTSRTGFGVLPAAQLNVHSDRLFNLALPPAETWIENGGFEESQPGLIGWTLKGAPAAVTTTAAHTGVAGLLMGQACPAPCLAQPQQVVEIENGSQGQTDMVYDGEGTGHLIWAAGGDLFYKTLSPTGVWSEMVDLGPGAGVPQLFVDGQNTLHLLNSLGDYDSGSMYYRQKPKSGNWSPAFYLGTGMRPRLTVDRQGKAYILYYSDNMGMLYYRARAMGGSWSPPEEVGYGSTAIGIDLSATADGVVHFVWQEHADGTYYRSRLPNGTLTPTVRLFDSFSDPIFLRATPDDKLYLFWMERTTSAVDIAHYAIRSPEGEWSPAYTLDGMAAFTDAVVDLQGDIHILLKSSDYYDSTVYYQAQNPDGSWSEIIALPTVLLPGNNFSLAVDLNAHIHLSWIGYDPIPDKTAVMHQGPSLAESEQYVTGSQVIDLPADSHAPTLSFEYALQGLVSGGSSAADVWVEAEGQRSQLISLVNSRDWQHAWIDLSAWAGDTVTLTFALKQGGGEPAASLQLDDIAVGAWLTPVVSGVSPNALEHPAGAQITITGQNFLEGASVMIGKTPVAEVARIDEQTLIATLPSELAPGIYNVWVTNPGGQANPAPNRMRLGETIFLPLVQ